MNVSYVRGGFIAFAAVASLTVAGCGGGGADPKADKPTVTTTSAPRASSSPQQSEGVEEPVEPLAVAKGQDGFELAISSAERDAGGFLTVKGTLKNTAEKGRAVPDAVRGDETEVLKHGTSLGGATLVDGLGKKRYYVLRDTDGRPLATTGLSILSAGKTLDVFMQFPAPPASTTEVSFQLPTFEPATLKLS
ncbi:hypothetical protein [Streptomyces griseus]|uniref:hypothetical protein n=1 Tax=Streptomyces griseus TaxID=1911 RepID=UPI0004C7E99F|nr:hypothetical protein [Streptomyces griseus]